LMAMWRSVVMLVVLAALPGCAAESDGPSGQPNSGIQGRVLAGPTCPVEIEASPCPDRPVQATVRVLAESPGNPPVTTFRSEEDGAFRVPLEPGGYLLVAEVAGTGALSARPVPVTVVEGTYAMVDVFLDTGIRTPG
jgi:hypothetical protein